MNTLILRFSCIALVGCFCSSCEDKELIQKNEELRLQLSEIEKKADIAEINAGQDPGDQTEALKKVNEELSQTISKLDTLDKEKEAIEKKQAELEKELREYQGKYRIQ